MQEKNIMNNNNNIINDGRTAGTDVSNLGDYGTMTVKTADGKEISIRLYGR